MWGTIWRLTKIHFFPAAVRADSLKFVGNPVCVLQWHIFLPQSLFVIPSRHNKEEIHTAQNGRKIMLKK